MRYWIAVPVLLLAACSGSGDVDEGEPAAASSDAAASTEPEAPEIEIAESAWRVRGPQGAVYVTYFDADGSFRDLRNGEPNQTGTWTEQSEGGVCLTPDAEGAETDCWTFKEEGEDGTVQARRGDLAVELEPVEYVPAEES